MITCQPTLAKEMLPNPVFVQVNESLPDLKAARLIADQKASELASDPMLLAWYEAKTGRFSPDVECCSEFKPGWVVYAESRGGNVTISINDQEYVFIYRDFAA
ncbi:MAG: AF1514 family protein [Deltaproteobacteria bacterium]|nr:AF1514 family protein [Deltaproteobacteria bacterium]